MSDKKESRSCKSILDELEARVTRAEEQTMRMQEQTKRIEEYTRPTGFLVVVAVGLIVVGVWNWLKYQQEQ